ncbi:MAG: ATP-binding cassette domain-containing protein [Tissierellia bacterium]|nr:ATP-binding cassette domain-containing protein [Tissierellia bacterium]
MLELRDIHKTFSTQGREERKIFQGLNITFHTGTTAIIGPNGCGKSTLLKMISGGLAADRGEILLEGEDVTKVPEEERALWIGRVSQNPMDSVAPSLTILENMALAMNKGPKSSFKNLLKNANGELISQRVAGLGLGLEQQLNAKTGSLSGGQRQSLSLLMATVNKPKVLLLDEHTAALDPKTSHLVMEETKRLMEGEEMTTLMITHNLRHAVEYADRIVMIQGGQVALDLDTGEITEEELAARYAQQVEESMLLCG